MTTIWHDPALRHLGFATAKVFECDAGHVTIGKTASCAEPFKSIITFNAYGITVVDHRPSTADYFRAIESDSDKEQYLLRAILAELTPALFAEIMNKVKDEAHREGQEDARAAMRHALGITYGF